MSEREKVARLKVKDKSTHNRLTDKMKQEILYFLELHHKERHPEDARSSKLLSKNLTFTKAVSIKAKELT